MSTQSSNLADALAEQREDRELVILIHGTGLPEPDAAKPKWWQPESTFANDLRERLGPRFDVGSSPNSAPFCWSGRNSEHDRRAGGKALLKRVRELEKKGIRYHLVGHSHGGSVIWHMLTAATRRGVNLKGLRSWTTVGTPFLEFAPLWHGLLAIVALLGFLFVVVNYLAETGEWFSKISWNIVKAIQNLTLPQASLPEWLAQVEIAVFIVLAVYLAVRPARWIGKVLAHAWGRLFEPLAAKRYGGRWVALWHPYDEPIHGLSATLVSPIWFAPRWSRATPSWYWRPLSWLYHAMVARPYDRLIAPTIDQFVWTLSMGRLQGSDMYGLAMVDAATAPRALNPGWPHLLAPVADEMTESAGKRAATTAGEMRQALAKLRAKAEGSAAVQEIASAISWSEILHTAYFDHPSVRELIGCQIMRTSQAAAGGSEGRIEASECAKWLAQAHTLPPVKPLRSFRPLRLEVAKVVAVYGVAILLGIALNATYVAYFRDDTADWQMQEVAKGTRTRASGQAITLVGDVLARLQAVAKLGEAREVFRLIPDENTRVMAAQRLAYVLAHAGKWPELEGVIFALEEAELRDKIENTSIAATALRAHALAGANAGGRIKSVGQSFVEQTITGLNQLKESALLDPEELGKLIAIAYRPLQAYGKEDVARTYDADLVTFLLELGQKGQCEHFQQWSDMVGIEPAAARRMCEDLFRRSPPKQITDDNMLDPLIRDQQFKEAAALVAQHLPTDNIRALVDRPWRLLGHALLLLEERQKDAAQSILTYFVEKKSDPADWASTALETIVAAHALGQLCSRLDRKEHARQIAVKTEDSAKGAPDMALRYAVAAILFQEAQSTPAAKRNLQSAREAAPAYNEPNDRLATILFLSRMERQIDTFSIANNALKVAMGEADYRTFTQKYDSPTTEDLIESAEASADKGKYRLARQTAELAGDVVRDRPGEPPRGGVLAAYAVILDKFIDRHPTASTYGVGSKARERWPELVKVHSSKTLPRAPRKGE